MNVKTVICAAAGTPLAGSAGAETFDFEVAACAVPYGRRHPRGQRDDPLVVKRRAAR